MVRKKGERKKREEKNKGKKQNKKKKKNVKQREAYNSADQEKDSRGKSAVTFPM